MRVLTRAFRLTISLLIGLGLSFVTSAAPNCPPQYQEICKQLIKTLEENNDGQHFYSWDGTKLTITNSNLTFYDTINYSPTDRWGGHNVEASRDEWILMSGRTSLDDFFPHLLF